MAVLVSIHELSKAFGARPLFEGLTFAIESGDRIGLIGPNGAGKSTLLRILASQTGPDRGSVSYQRGLKVGFLEQVPQFREGATILSTILEGVSDAVEDPHHWEHVGAAQELISRLHLDRFGDDTRIEKLSGGWKKRVALARELVRKPDLLLLDEPTNHLDVESILWLERFLARAPFATLTITHDRLFLQRIANRIIELDPRHVGGLLSVQGDYASYLETREQLIAAQERREIDTQEYASSRDGVAQAGSESAHDQTASPNSTRRRSQTGSRGSLRAQSGRTAKLDFQGADKNPKKLIEARGISKSFGDKNIFTGLDLMITPGTRIGLLGPNGAGKSTLIRVLLGT